MVEFLCNYWVIILILLAIVASRVIFRIFTRHYESAVGEIVDFHTERYFIREHTYYSHKPIVEFFANGKTYRCVKEAFYNSSASDWQNSLVKSSYRDYVKVRYDPKDPRKNYCLYSIKDFKYNIIMVIPIIVAIAVMFIIFSFYK